MYSTPGLRRRGLSMNYHLRIPAGLAEDYLCLFTICPALQSSQVTSGAASVLFRQPKRHPTRCLLPFEYCSFHQDENLIFLRSPAHRRPRLYVLR